MGPLATPAPDSGRPSLQPWATAFPAGAGIGEDPASGAANGLIAAWIRHCEPEGPLARGYRVSQGREIGRDAAIDVLIGAGGDVWVGGRTDTIVSGSLAWEPTSR